MPCFINRKIEVMSMDDVDNVRVFHDTQIVQSGGSDLKDMHTMGIALENETKETANNLDGEHWESADDICERSLESVDNSSDSDDGLQEEIGDVDELNDVFEALTVTQKLGISVAGLHSLEDMKYRIVLHSRKFTESNPKVVVQKSLLKADQDDQKRRQKVISVIEELLEIVNHDGPDRQLRRDSRLINGLLRQEGATDNLAEDCAERIADISSSESLIIVAGETSAGKSSVLNLLFGDDILPVHNNSCTSVITVIKYNKRRHARVLYKTGEPVKEFNLDPAGLEQLHHIAFMQGPDERECHNIEQVQVYLPLPILESGLVLVDTPGIGENEFLENELISFIDKHNIHGFMYIIKTDNAGGVQEDRLLNLLKIVVQKQRLGSKYSRTNDLASLRFDPRAALFVCNRFDLIDKAELDKVKQNAIDKLRACWPGFDESQMVFFSTEKAKRDVTADEDYINDNYKGFLESLRDLVLLAKDKRLKTAYRWIEKILKRTVHYLKSTVRRLDLSDIELTERSDEVRKKLDMLQLKSKKVIDDIHELVESQSTSLQEQLRDYIKSPASKFKLTSCWTEDEIPKVSHGLGDWHWIKRRIQEAFYDRLIACVERWDDDEKKIDQIEEGISIQVKTDLLFLEAELKEIEREINGEDSSDSSGNYSQLARSRRRSTLPALSPTKARFLISNAKLPLKLAGRILKPLTSLVTAIKNTRKENEYKREPVKVAQEVANEFYKELISAPEDGDHGIAPFVDYLLERPKEYIGALERKIPDMIMVNQLLLGTFLESLDEERKYQEEYDVMMTNTEQLRRSLVEFGEGYIFVNDFSKNEIQIQKYSQSGSSKSVAFKVSDFLRTSSDELESHRRRDFRGLWTVIYSGELVRDGMEHAVAIKVYLPSSGVESTYKEVAKLRCLTTANVNIAEFLGIHNAEMATPAFVYAGSLRSVRRFLNSFCCKRECVPEILEQTANALEYLHNKGMVHMELTQNTLTVDENGTVQLSGACLPRPARLPDVTDCIETGNFVYLAPEVLRGGEYTGSADIYSFGLLILELVQVDMPVVFQAQRKMALCDFIREVNPETMLNLREMVDVFTIKTRALVQNCLEIDQNNRPEMREFVEYTSYIRGERDAMAKLPSRRSRPIVKRHSMATKL